MLKQDKSNHCNSISVKDIDIESLNYEKMFNHCSSLQQIDINLFNIKEPIDFEKLFHCDQLKEIKNTNKNF